MFRTNPNQSRENSFRAQQIKLSYLADGERELWKAVLERVIEDALILRDRSELDQQLARSWIGAFPSKDFRMVCDLAGLDPPAVHERIKRWVP